MNYFTMLAGIKLFGRGYSGLEYDYRGLIRVYTETSKPSIAEFYISELHEWHLLRENEIIAETKHDPLEFTSAQITSSFTNMPRNLTDALAQMVGRGLLPIPTQCVLTEGWTQTLNNITNHFDNSIDE